jgi:hypothetical protein
MSIEFLLPVFLGIVFFAVVTLITVYRPHPHNIDNVILFARRLVGPVKTEASRKPMPIDGYVARDLLARHAITRYKGSGD